MLSCITIKAKKQANGLWGTPRKLISFTRTNYIGKFDDLLLSAIIMALHEQHPTENIRIEVFGGNSFMVDVGDKLHMISLHDYGLIGNKLYYIKSEKDKKQFDRILKLKKINDAIISTMGSFNGAT